MIATLLKLEYYKNFSYKPFKVFSILYFAILIGLLFIGLVDIQITDEFSINLKEQGIYNFPAIWNFTTYIVAILKIFLGFIIIFSITQEFTNRMFKQNIIDGLGRENFVLSKVFTITIFSFVSTLIVFLITLFLGYKYAENSETKLVLEELFFIGNYFLKLFTFFSFLMFLSVLFRKSVFVFLAMFVWWIAEGILSGIESFIKFSGLESKEAVSKAQESFFLTKYLPLESMSQLIPNPLLRLDIIKITGLKYHFSYPTDSLIACIVWSLLFIFGSYYILKKKDW